MTLTVNEFETVDPVTGDPVHPASTVTHDVALDATHACKATTRIVEVISSSNIRLAIGATPAAGDYYLAADAVGRYRLPGKTAVTLRATAGDAEASGAAVDVTIALAVSATTDGMDITVTAVDSSAETVAGVHNLELWMSESAVGAGLTADTYSGSLTASTGAILTTLTAKKHFNIVTAATGIFVGTLVDSANPTDQYVVVRKPDRATVKVSAASGVNWEGV